jgi:hypothetical protein
LQVIELRQYRLRGGQRDLLIELFDREFVESQEAVGMKVIGQFRVIDDPDRFIWLRGALPTCPHALARSRRSMTGRSGRGTATRPTPP